MKTVCSQSIPPHDSRYSQQAARTVEGQVNDLTERRPALYVMEKLRYLIVTCRALLRMAFPLMLAPLHSPTAEELLGQPIPVVQAPLLIPPRVRRALVLRIEGRLVQLSAPIEVRRIGRGSGEGVGGGVGVPF